MNDKICERERVVLFVEAPVADIAVYGMGEHLDVGVRALDPEVPEDLEQATHLMCSLLERARGDMTSSDAFHRTKQYLQTTSTVALELRDLGKKIPGVDRLGRFVTKLQEKTVEIAA